MRALGRRLVGFSIALVVTGVVRAETVEPTSVPATPTLTVTKNVGTGEVVLTWTATASPYAVVRDTDPNPNDFTPDFIASGLAATTFADPVLNNAINYFYLVEDANAETTVFGRSSGAGLPGTSVTLEGVGFSSTLTNNRVFLARSQATVTGVTGTTLTFTVPTASVSGQIIVVTPSGANLGGEFYQIGTQGLANISSVAVNALGTKFVADTGPPATADRVFTFDPATGSRTQVGALNEATGLPMDASNRVYYGNALVNTLNGGTIERTDSGGAEVVYRQCGTGTTDPCYVWGIGLDPDLTDFGADGRVYVANGANNTVRLVPPTGLIQTFATGFSFGDSPRGIVVDRDSASSFYHDVYISDATSVRRYNSATVPGTLEMTYSPSMFPFVTPRQMALTPTNRVRLLVADSGQGRVVMINPASNASKVINIPLNSPRAIAIEHDSLNNVNTAWVGEPDRVLKLPVHRTVYLSIWVAAGSGISDQEVRDFVTKASASLQACGIELQIRDDQINTFVAGPLLDLDVFVSAASCGNPALQRTPEEIALMSAPRRSSEQTDLNVYFVRSLTSDTTRIGEAITADCFVGMNDATESGVIISVQRLRRSSTGQNIRKQTIWVLGHEIGHALLNRNNWTPGMDEHFARSGAALPANNIMTKGASVGRYDFNDPDQCLNINADATIFRGDP